MASRTEWLASREREVSRCAAVFGSRAELARLCVAYGIRAISWAPDLEFWHVVDQDARLAYVFARLNSEPEFDGTATMVGAVHLDDQPELPLEPGQRTDEGLDGRSCNNV